MQMGYHCVLFIWNVQLDEKETRCSHYFRMSLESATRIKHKIFFWLLLHDKVITRNLLKRQTFCLKTYDCVYCNEEAEKTSMHLFWDCTFSQDCWRTFLPNKRRGISTFDEIILASMDLPSKLPCISIL